METIKIQYLNDEIERLRYIDGKSDWIDLRAAEEVELKAGEFKLIHLGVAMQLPEGYEAQMRPRSGLALKHGITLLNTPGTIDADYRGEIGIILINLSSEYIMGNISRHDQKSPFHEMNHRYYNQFGKNC